MGQREVDETGTGNFGFFNPGRQRQCLDGLFSQGARVLAQWAGKLHRQVGGVIAMAGILGAFDHESGIGGFWRYGLERIGQEFSQVLLEIELRHGAADLCIE